MKMKLAAILILLVLTQPLFTQSNIYAPLQLKLKLEHPGIGKTSFVKPGYSNKSELPIPVLLAIPLFFINPVLVFEDKKIFWGLTREISFSTFPYGRFSFEYSFLFRTFNKHHLRFSYSYDFINQPGQEWILAAVSPGAGYFTDTKNKGVFVQLAAGSFIPTPLLMINLYLKYRYTYIFDENETDIHDVSLGTGIIF